MANSTESDPGAGGELEEIKRLVVVAMFSDDELMEQLVLKGGNALDLVHKASTRASLDVDFSMEKDFLEKSEAFRTLERVLDETFRAAGYVIFDVEISERPERISEELADFWGGYAIEFKLIDQRLFGDLSKDIDKLRRHALKIGRGQKFSIEISKHEYTRDKQRTELDGHAIFVYSPAMMACEKLRAICQQLPGYGSVVKRGRGGAPRARDFVDIHALVTKLGVDLSSAGTREMLVDIFRAKRVPLEFLGVVEGQRDFHRLNYPAVEATVKVGVKLEGFDYYFDFVLEEIKKLEPLWNV